MTHDPDQPATTTEDAEDIEDVEEVVTVVCGRTWLDMRLDRYVFVFGFRGTRRRFALHHANPLRYRLGHTYRLTLTPLPRRPGDPPAERTDPAADVA
jgi:hypothetical protein